MLLKSWFEVTQSIFLQSCWECRTQWSQRSRPVVLKWLSFFLWSIIHYRVEGASLMIPPQFFSFTSVNRGAVAKWVGALAWAFDRTVSWPGSNPTAAASLRNFGNSVYPALPVSFRGDTKSRRSLLSGVYARGSKRSHQSALECVTVVDSTTHSKLPDLQSAIMRRKTVPCSCIGRRRRTVACPASTTCSFCSLCSTM